MNTVICGSVMELVGGGQTLSSLSLVSIARDTGISRNSIYRRWKSKEQLFADVVKSMQRDLTVPTDQSARESIAVLIEAHERGPGRNERRVEQAIVAERQNFPDLYEQYVTDVLTPFDHAMKLAIRSGKETREIRGDVDENILSNVLHELAHVRISSDDRGRSEDESMGRRMIDLIFDGVSPR
jgi:AcrR family transcriptional regulator